MGRLKFSAKWGTTSIAWGFAVCFIIVILGPLQGSALISGWDLVPQYYLFEQMRQNLLSFRLSAYDTQWFLGYPGFVFYGPLTYVLGVLVYWFPGKWLFMLLSEFSGAESADSLLPLVFSINLYFLFLSLFFVQAFVFAARRIFPGMSVVAAILLACLYLTHPTSALVASVGLLHGLLHGHIAEFTATPFLLLYLGALHGFVDTSSRKTSWRMALVAVLAFACLILTHALTTIFATAYTGLFLLLTFQFRILAFPLLASILTIFWWSRFVLSLGYSSGSEIFVSTVDPLHGILPNLERIFSCISLRSPTGLALLPYSTLLLLLCFPPAFLACYRRQRAYIPLVFLLLLLTLPRSFLGGVMGLPVHYYRFVTPLVLLSYLFVASGLSVLAEWKAGAEKLAQRAKVLFPIATVLVGLAFVGNLTDASSRLGSHSFVSNIAGLVDSSCVIDHAHIPTTHQVAPINPMLPQYFERLYAADRMIAWLDANTTAPRIVVEIAHENERTLGSPHYFASVLPLFHNAEVFPGLLAESSLTFGVLNPFLQAYSRSLDWGRNNLKKYFASSGRRLSHFLGLLEWYGVSHFLVSSADTAALFRNFAKDLPMVHREDRFALFALPNARPRVEELSGAPFLFIERGGITFRDFSEFWVRDPQNFGTPLIWTPRALSELPASEREQIGGVVFSYPVDREIPEPDLEELKALGKPFILLDGGDSDKLEFSQLLRAFPRFAAERDLSEILAIILAQGGSLSGKREITPQVIGKTEFHFTSTGPTIVRYSYFPSWKLDDGEPTIYMIAPTMMFFFGSGAEQVLRAR